MFYTTWHLCKLYFSGRKCSNTYVCIHVEVKGMKALNMLLSTLPTYIVNPFAFMHFLHSNLHLQFLFEM